MKNTLTIGTWNVHGWRDAGFVSNVERITAQLKASEVDIVGLQEVDGSVSEQLGGRRVTPLVAAGAALGMKPSSPLARGNALLSRLPIVRWSSLSWGRTRAARRGQPKQRALCGEFERCGSRFRVVVLHLDHVSCENRMAQLSGVQQALAELESLPSLWLGDFNALTRRDYTKARWAEIAATRRENRWEPPMTAVTDWMRSEGFVDCWRAAGECGEVGTCRFETRIDYLWADPAFLREWEVTSCGAISGEASDHKLVTAHFSRTTAAS